MPVMRLLTGSVAALALASAAATVAGASGDDKQDKSFQRNFPSSRAAPAPATPPQAAATKVAEPDLSAILAAFAPPPEADPAPGESR